MDENGRKKKSAFPLVLFVLLIIVVSAIISLNRYKSGQPDEKADSRTMATPTTETGVYEPIEAERGIFMHCGNSMRPAAEVLAAEFQERYGIGVRLNFGGSSELLSSIELGEIGDIYLPHDPYAELLEEKGLLDHYEVVGYLEPVIIVPKGNPQDIEAMSDLVTRDLRISLPDRRYATAGRLVNEAFEDMGLHEEMEENLAMEGRSHGDVAQALIWEHVDAAMVWNFIGFFYEDKLDMVYPPDVDFPEVRVTLCLLKNAQDPEAAKKFMELATSDFGRSVFMKYGYIVED